MASLDKWEDYTKAKEAMFFETDTADAPWTVIKSDCKKRAPPQRDALRAPEAALREEGRRQIRRSIRCCRPRARGLSAANGSATRFSRSGASPDANGAALPAFQVREGERRHAQQQPRRASRDLGRRVERIADDGVADRREVHAQLVRAAGELVRAQAHAAGFARDHAPARQRGLAVLAVDLLARPVRPVGGQGQIDLAYSSSSVPATTAS